MLIEAQSALLRGFITTLEFARIESLTLSKPGRTLMSQSMSVRRTNMDDQGHAFQNKTDDSHAHYFSINGDALTVKRGRVYVLVTFMRMLILSQ
jgi:hypothetical protein